MRFAVLLAIAGCYSPGSDTSCVLTCAVTADCPGELACSENRCTAPGTTCKDTGDGGMVVVDGATGCLGHPAGLLPNTCFEPPFAPLVSQLTMIDTSADVHCDPTRNDACFVVAEKIQIQGPIDVRGSRPLVLWASDEIRIIAGSIDVSSRTGVRLGPGANPSGLCAELFIPLNGTVPQVAPGGSGGAFGGDGGIGGSARVTGGIALAGNPNVTSTEAALRGGCPGGTSNTTVGGAGGGAIYLMAGNLIRIENSIIDASGGGGGGGSQTTNTKDGGGGGGSGGLIGLDAPLVELVDATLVALGGGGGGGSGVTGPGGVGGSPTTEPVARGSGGTMAVPNNSGGLGCAVNGGTGGTGNAVASNSTGGGGGGGGGAGYVRQFAGTVQLIGTVTTAPALE